MNMTPSLIWSFTRQELVDRYAGSMLGFAWAFLQPLFMMFIFVVIFGQIMAARLPGVDQVFGYSIYLLAGMLPWVAFSNTVARTATLFVDKKHVLSKVGLPLTTLPLFVLLTEAITYAIGLGLMGVLLVVLQAPPRPYILLLPWVFLIQQILALGVGLILAVLNVFVRDVREFVNILIQLWFWFTPIVWVPATMSPRLFGLLDAANPMVSVITAYQAMFIGQGVPEYRHLMVVTGVATALLIAAYMLVRRMEKDVRDVL
jgi:lipopolysaccharide transport system permease protein